MNSLEKCGDLVDGKYRTDALLGSGGMGVVYRATHVVLGRSVAIKALLPEYAQDKRAVRRFLQEAQIAGSLGHDNICEVTDVGTLRNGAPYLVMQLLKGRTLSSLLRDAGRLSPARAIDIIDQVLCALDAAHQKGIVHRDLKPDNIFITRVGDREDFVKLLDFGISKILNPKEELTLTRTGTVIGSPHYMAPEQAKGVKGIDQRVDIYAVGVILYRLVTGIYPFQGESYNELLANVFTASVPLPGSIVPGISSALELVILKAMHRDPRDRFERAIQMRRALNAVLGSIASIATGIDADVSEDTVLNSGRYMALPNDEHDVDVASDARDKSPSTGGKKRKYRQLRPGLVVGATLLLIALGAVCFLEQAELSLWASPRPPAIDADSRSTKRPLSSERAAPTSSVETQMPMDTVTAPLEQIRPSLSEIDSASRKRTDDTERRRSVKMRYPQKSNKKKSIEAAPMRPDISKGRSGTHIMVNYE